MKSIFNGRRMIKYKLYIDARNILDARNVRWMDASGRIGGELGDPSAYYIGRRMNMGIEFEL